MAKEIIQNHVEEQVK